MKIRTRLGVVAISAVVGLTALGGSAHGVARFHAVTTNTAMSGGGHSLQLASLHLDKTVHTSSEARPSKMFGGGGHS